MKKINITELREKMTENDQELNKMMDNYCAILDQAEIIEIFGALEKDNKTIVIKGSFDSGGDSYEVVDTYKLEDDESFAEYFAELLDDILSDKRNIKYALLNPPLHPENYFEIVTKKN